MHFLALTATVAVGAAFAAKFALLSLERDTAATARVSHLPEVALSIQELHDSPPLVVGRNEVNA